MIFKVDTCILALLHDTSSFNIWRTGKDKAVRGGLADRIGRMSKHIKNGTMPRELAMNTADVITMIPEIQRDYVMLSGDRLESAKKSAIAATEAKRQKEIWSAKEKDAKDALAVMLDDFEEIRSGSGCLAKWIFRTGKESIGKPEGVKSKETLLEWIKKKQAVSISVNEEQWAD